jgi:GxxExxY protein
VKQGGEEERRSWARSERVIGALIEVHRHLGPGLLESAYEACLCRELAPQGLPFERQRAVPLTYKGISLDCGYRLDVVVDASVLVELKTVDALLPVHIAQDITYLTLSRLPVGLLVNFNVPLLRYGLRRVWVSSDSSPHPLPVSPLSTESFDDHAR